MSAQSRAATFADRAHIEFLKQVEQGEAGDLNSHHVRAAAIHTREDVALLCFWAGEIHGMLKIIAGVMVVNLAVLVAIWQGW